MKRRIFALLLAGACAAALGGCARETKEETGAPVGVAVQVQTVESRDISTENKVSGSVTADDATSIYISATAKCTAVYFEAGDRVEKGDVICTLDLGSTLATYSAARISYDSAYAAYRQQKEIFDKQIALYEKTLENTKALFAIGAASQLEIDTAELQLLSARAQRDSTLAQLEAGIQSYRSNLAQLNLVMDNVDDDGNVIAPAGGTLLTLTAAEGGFVSASYPVAVIGGAEQMKITVYVSEALVPKLSLGDTVSVTVSAADAAFTGVIRAIDRTANPQMRLYPVVISVPNDVTGLISGMFADVTFHTETASGAVAVPSEAILTSNGEQYVYLVEDGKAKYTPVTTGLIGSGVTEIVSGLSAGQTLVTVGQQYLSDGAAVRIVGAEAGA